MRQGQFGNTFVCYKIQFLHTFSTNSCRSNIRGGGHYIVRNNIVWCYSKHSCYLSQSSNVGLAGQNMFGLFFNVVNCLNWEWQLPTFIGKTWDSDKLETHLSVRKQNRVNIKFPLILTEVKGKSGLYWFSHTFFLISVIRLLFYSSQ